MTCRELTDFIADYLSGELSPEVRGAFDTHLSRCPNCVNYLASYEAAVTLGRGALTADDVADASLAAVPDELVRAILSARRS